MKNENPTFNTNYETIISFQLRSFKIWHCFLNRSAVSKMIEFDWTKKIVSNTVSNRILDTSAEVFKIKDIWTKKEPGNPDIGELQR